MKHSREFEIAWQGLKPGTHKFVYSIDDEFMKDRHLEDAFTDWNATVSLTFDKKSDFFLLHFDIDGNVTVPCDRCGDPFKLTLWDEFDLVVKLTGEDTDEKDDEDDIIFIPKSETVIDISNWLYEFVILSIPLQRIHPDDANGNPGCNPQALQLLNMLSDQGDVKKNNIWKGLDAIKVTEEPKVAKAKGGVKKKSK